MHDTPRGMEMQDGDIIEAMRFQVAYIFFSKLDFKNSVAHDVAHKCAR